VAQDTVKKTKTKNPKAFEGNCGASSKGGMDKMNKKRVRKIVSEYRGIWTSPVLLWGGENLKKKKHSRRERGLCRR